MDIIKEMRRAYYRSLFGHLTVDGVNIPIYHKMVLKGQNPDVYCIISNVGNSSKNTFSTIDSLYVIQITLVTKSLTNPNNVSEDLASQFWTVVKPNAWTFGVVPNGFNITDTQMILDTDRPVYIDSSGKTVLERVIQISHNIYHTQRF